MELQEVQLDVDDVQPGMYVSRLDREWLGTGFPLQGFEVQDTGDLQRLKACCRWVVVDALKSHAKARDALATLKPRAQTQVPRLEASRGEADYVAHDALPPMASELPAARAAVDTLGRLAVSVIDRLSEEGVVTQGEIRASVAPIVKSVIRQPEAAFWLLALQKHASGIYRHAVNCAAFATLLGRQLRLPEDRLVSLATGGLLLDLGLTRTPEHLAVRQDLSLHERACSDPGHVQRGLEMYHGITGGTDHVVEQMLRYHHERFDGTGFPQGVSGYAIPLPGRIAAIIDAYDAMVSAQPNRPALSQHDALQSLYRDRERLFQAELVECFMRAMSVYPIGTLVELNSGEVGIVMSQNPTRRLRPTLMLLTGADKRLRQHFKEVNLVVADRAGLPESALNIVRCLPVGAYGLDPTELYL